MGKVTYFYIGGAIKTISHRCFSDVNSSLLLADFTPLMQASYLDGEKITESSSDGYFFLAPSSSASSDTSDNWNQNDLQSSRFIIPYNIPI